MAKRRRQPTIYGPNGSPVSFVGDFYEAGRSINRYGDRNAWFYQDGARDHEKVLSNHSWLNLLQSGRYLFANTPLLRGALLEQASYSFPLTAQYIGKDKDWGRIAEEWLYSWKQIQNVRGLSYDCHTTSRIRLLGRKVDGDIATLLTRDEGTDYPKIQLIRAHRIADPRKESWRLKEGRIVSGEYAGKLCQNGVVLSDYGGPLAYHVTGEKPDDDQFVSAANMFLTYRPEVADQSRGMSELVASVLSFSDIKRLREYEMRAQQIQASFAVTENNEEGEPPPGMDALEAPASTDDPSGTATGLNFRTMDGGLISYFRSGSGSGIELNRPNRPGPDCQAFEDRIVRGALYGIEWDADFAVALKEPGGAWARTTLQKVNRAIKNNQCIEERAQYREDMYGLSVAMEKKLIPKPKGGDWYTWNYHGPARLTADSGNEENAKREALKMGIMTKQEYAAEKGNWWEDVSAQREAEVLDLLVRATRLQSQFGELSLAECVALLEQRSPNVPVETNADKEAQAKPAPRG